MGVISLGHSHIPLIYSVQVLALRIIHLWSNNASDTTTLGNYISSGQWICTPPSFISIVLRATIQLLSMAVDFLPDCISAPSLQAVGAMSLLCAKIVANQMKLI